jgi:hypothetical protein
LNLLSYSPDHDEGNVALDASFKQHEQASFTSKNGIFSIE